MHEGARAGSITCSARSVGGDAGSRVRTTEKRPPHMFPQRRIGPCTRYRSPESSLAATARVVGQFEVRRQASAFTRRFSSMNLSTCWDTDDRM